MVSMIGSFAKVHCLIGSLLLTQCFGRSSVETSSSFGSDNGGITKTIPRSTNLQSYSEGAPLWKPSSLINDDGFLVKHYNLIPGEWEEETIITGKHRKQRLFDLPVKIRQVPGDGNCLFHALTVCLTRIQDGKHFCFDNIDQLRQCSRSLREKAVDYMALKPSRLLYLQGREYIRADDLIEMAANPYDCTGAEYCSEMRKERYWGGGPEIVGVSNLLRRPIHVYELYTVDEEPFQLRRMACFGSPKYDRKEPLHILSADSRFPDIEPGSHLKSGNHFLAIFPQTYLKPRKKVRGGATSAQAKTQKQKQKGTRDGKATTEQDESLDSSRKKSKWIDVVDFFRGVFAGVV